jgi:hypothetical protein
MTNPTSNFGWQMPTSTDLVTDLPADFEVFGQAVDTSLADLKGGTSGQILSKASNTDMDFTWITNDVGDITAVTAGTGITGGGTSGAVTVSFDQANFGGGQNAAGKNEVLNSNFSCWQRGTSFAGTGAAGTYSADRWKYYNNGTSLTVSRQATGDTTNLPFIQYCARVARNNAATNTNSNYLEQSFESANSIPFAGKTVTLSFYARKGANYSTASSNLYAELRTGTGTDQDWLTGYTGDTAAISQAAVLTTTWQRFSYSATLSASMTEMAVVFASVPVGTAGAADYFEVTGVQVEAAATASPYAPNGATYQAELAACQRYYFRQSLAAGATSGSAFGSAKSTTVATMVYSMPVTMRVAPTSGEHSNVRLWDGANVFTVTSAVFSGSTDGFGTADFGVASGLTQYRPYQIIANASLAGYVAFSAEL